MGKGIWWSNLVWFHRKSDALKTGFPIVRFDCPGYCNPQQLVEFLNERNKSYFK